MKNKFIKTMFLSISMLLLVGITPLTAAAQCTNWETYSTTYGNCSSAWCNPIWKPSGLKQNVTYHQSQVCPDGNGGWIIKTRSLDTTECNC